MGWWFRSKEPKVSGSEFDLAKFLTDMRDDVKALESKAELTELDMQKLTRMRLMLKWFGMTVGAS